MQRPFPAYEGDEPYIFVSYSHGDSRAVYSELARLREMGFNIWYDEGISPGSRWTDDLAKRISGATVLLAFVTPGFVGSENCRNEIDFALEQQRDVLLVHLRPTELPGGMRLALSGRQAILKHEHSQVAYEQKLFAALETRFSETAIARELRPIRGRRTLTAAFALAAVLAVGGLAGGYVFLNEPDQRSVVQRSGTPLPILIADFVNETGQPIFDGVLEEALKVAMEGAPFITSYPRKEALAVLAEHSGATELTHENASLVALREDLELVLAGFVRPEGDGYRVEVEVRTPLGEVEMSTAEDAASPLEALTAITEVAKTLRRGLGDVTVEDTHLKEVFTASSMKAVSEYTRAQALAADWKHAEAIPHYERAVEGDPEFGRAYGGWAYSASALGQREQSEALWEKCIAHLNTMTERERLRTLGTYYMTVGGNVDQAIESYESLVQKYPSDAAGYNNLAVAYFSRMQMDDARETGRKLLDIYPTSLLYRGNYALYNMYAGDVATAVEYASSTLEQEPGYYPAYLPLAFEALLRVDYAGAEDQYSHMANTGATGVSLAELGRADLALARGSYSAAIDGLEPSIANDRVSGNDSMVAIKSLWLARALVLAGRSSEAAPVLEALDLDKLGDRHVFELGELRAELGDLDAATAAADRLGGKVPAGSRALAYIIRGIVALKRQDAQLAVDHLKKALSYRDHWLARYYLGQAYLQIDARRVEALDTLDRVWQRRGEGYAAFLDDTPTYQRLVNVKYWQGRANENLGIRRDALASYDDFLRRRDLAAGDPLVADASARRRALTAAAAD